MVSGEDDEPGPFSIVIDDPVGPRTRAPTDTAAPAMPRRASRSPDWSRAPQDPDDTGPVTIFRPDQGAPAALGGGLIALERGETPAAAEAHDLDLEDGPTPTAPVPAYRSPFGPPIVVESALVARGQVASSGARRPLPRDPSRPRPGGAGARPVRDYPVLRSLIQDPDALAGEERAASTAVPRAFVRAGPAYERPASARPHMDDMLEEMAEGLLVGGDGAGMSEIRVTLGEEFFGGTELRIQRTAEGVTAILRPPDRDTYRILAGELPRLRVHLEERGLRVSNLRVEEP